MSWFKYLYKESSNDFTQLFSAKSWDYFITSHTESERVSKVYDYVQAGKKYKFYFREYGYTKNNDYPKNNNYFISEASESEAILKILSLCNFTSHHETICIDSTGFLRPYLALLILRLYKLGFKKIDVVYSEPVMYTENEKTPFSKNILEIRQIHGFEGEHNVNTDSDFLIINSGYESDLISAVAENKKNTKKYQLIGFPSLRADMFQQSILKISSSQDYIGSSYSDEKRNIFAPSNDPFITASILDENISRIIQFEKPTNIYIAPLATKPQLVGIVLYYISGLCTVPLSLIFPFTAEYSNKTTTGISRSWIYTLEFIDGI